MLTLLTIRGADTGLSEIHSPIEHFADSQVAQDEAAVAQQKHVLSLEVSVQHLVAVHVVQPQR